VNRERRPGAAVIAPVFHQKWVVR